MNLMTMMVVGVGLFAGYWIVSRLFPSDLDPEQPTQTPPASPAVDEPSWHEVLGVAPTAGAAEIKQAYKSLMSQYHPDKVATLGQELRDVAERKSKEITLAYREALRACGSTP